jgi:hypothetical protein
VFAELATRLKSPAVIGELFAGVVLGPSLLGWVEPTEAIRLMAGIGIILLLFEVGNLCRTWAGEWDLQQRDLRLYGHCHHPDHVAAAPCHEVVLRTLWTADTDRTRRLNDLVISSWIVFMVTHAG